MSSTILLRTSSHSPAVVALPPGYEVRDLVLALGKPMEQAVLAVDTQRLGCKAHGCHFEVGETWDDTDTRDVSEGVDKIFRMTLANVKDLSEFCAKVVHVIFL